MADYTVTNNTTLTTALNAIGTVSKTRKVNSTEVLVRGSTLSSATVALPNEKVVNEACNLGLQNMTGRIDLVRTLPTFTSIPVGAKAVYEKSDGSFEAYDR